MGIFNGCRAEELKLHCQRGQVLTAHISRGSLAPFGWGGSADVSSAQVGCLCLWPTWRFSSLWKRTGRNG